MAHVKRPTNEQPRDRVLSAQELSKTVDLPPPGASARGQGTKNFSRNRRCAHRLADDGATTRRGRAHVVVSCNTQAHGFRDVASAITKIPRMPMSFLLSPLTVLKPLRRERFVFALSPAEKHKVPEALRKRTVNPYWRVAAAAGPLRKALGCIWRRSCATHLAQHGERPVIAAVLGAQSPSSDGTVTTRRALQLREGEARGVGEVGGGASG